MLTLADAIDDLHLIAVIEKRRQSPARLAVLADYCVQELDQRGIPDAETEVTIPGIGRNKKWDVAWRHGGKVRLGISLKSLLSNIPGTVPNRADDLMGEMANVQLYSPEIVTGYIMIFDAPHIKKGTGERWVDVFRSYVKPLAGRQAPAWAAGMVEALAIVEVDFSQGPQLITPTNLNPFFDLIAHRVIERNPSLRE